MAMKLREIWSGPGGCAEVLKMAIPLIISTSAFTIQMFIDRVFLMWHDSASMPAAMFGGLVSFVPFSFFMGTATYANTFVAQYYGAGQNKRVGAAIWQGIYFALGAGLVMAGLMVFARPVISWAGHDPVMQNHELIYLQILCIGAMPGLLGCTLSCFHTGRGKTVAVMWVNIGGTIVNIILDYALIFGNWGFPEWGVKGAAIATIISSCVTCLTFFVLYLRADERREYATLSGWRFDKDLFVRLMRYGLPSGTQFMLDVFGFAVFVTFIGRISTICFSASSMAFQINHLAFMPMIGFNIAVSTMVGQALGKDRADLAQRCTYSAAGITMIYMTLVALGYWLVPQMFMYPFAVQADAATFAQIEPIVVKLLLFASVYCLFDTGNLIFSAALKGAGDTRFVMFASVGLNWLLMVIPTYIAVKLTDGVTALYWAWACLSVYVCVLAIMFSLRFLAGKWKKMRVIEATGISVPSKLPAIPTIETDSA